ncbi:hypothetical protein QTP88_021727 [Uroleucon formosanum]
MDNKRKRSFFDDGENQIRKMPKTSNATIDYSLDADTEESKSQTLCESANNRQHTCMSIITISDDSSVEESASLLEDYNVFRNEDPLAGQIFSVDSLSESTYSRSHACMSTITISDDSSEEESTSLVDDHDVIRNKDPIITQIYSTNSLSESTNNRQHTCMSIITISDDSSVEESASLLEDYNVFHNEDPLAGQIFSVDSLSESINNRQHTCMSIITISDDSSVPESTLPVEGRNAIRFEDPIAVQNCTANCLSECTINRHNGNSSVSENLILETKRSLHNCLTEVPMFFLTTCEHFEVGSTTHIKLENPNCSKLEDQDFDNENLLSTSYMPTQKTVLQKCSSAEALETYEYVPVQNVGRHVSIAKVKAWNYDSTSSISYDWNMMDTKLPKRNRNQYTPGVRAMMKT